MWREHPIFKAPEDPNQIIWKYMSFPKFLYLLEKNALFFTRADKLRDIAEGTYPEIVKKIIINTDNKILKHNLSMLLSFTESEKKKMIINCWSINQFEDYCLWKCYSDFRYGIAIKSTYSRLKDCFHQDEENTQYVGKVEYINFSEEKITIESNTYKPFIWKMSEFSSEQEMRVISSPKVGFGYEGLENKNGLNMEVDLNILFDEIVISPLASNWFEEIVHIYLERYKIDKEVIRSRINII